MVLAYTRRHSETRQNISLVFEVRDMPHISLRPSCSPALYHPYDIHMDGEREGLWQEMSKNFVLETARKSR